MLIRATNALEHLLQRKRDDQARAHTGLQRWSAALNARQRDFVQRSMAEGGGNAIAVTGYAQRYGVTDQTARNDLTELTRWGLVLKEKHGRKHLFRVPADIEQRVGASPPSDYPDHGEG
ncbi:MAG: DeoR family transcriptional regulator [Micrococcus sp.]|nr:DeoR family transcriptional regulator [Micrococcus sp.]